ncbi:hypothetical protein IFO70_37795 [Phormidium tenue FACHB-886]|nr:hypothetical protein [Phormidium tenue FACHB-886]
MDRNSPILASDGSRYQIYEFQGGDGQTVTILLESQQFDPYLIVVDAQGNKLGENDDAFSDSLNASLTLMLPAAGQYRVIANAVDASGQGQYRLTIR